MEIYFVLNGEKLRFYEPYMIDDGEENVQIQSIEYFSLEYLEEL